VANLNDSRISERYPGRLTIEITYCVE